MTVDGIKKEMDYDAVVESGWNPPSNRQIQPECVETERADAWRDGRTRLARTTTIVHETPPKSLAYHVFNIPYTGSVSVPGPTNT